MIDRCRAEVEELHEFFSAWFAGERPDDDAGFARLQEVLAPGFELISPEGMCIPRQALLEGLKGAHGRHRDASPRFTIRVDAFRARQIDSGLVLATYEEWQPDASVSADAERGRRSTALFRESAGLPNGVEWVHVHETWL